MKTTTAPTKLILLLLPAIVFMTWYNLRMEKQRFEPSIYTLSAGKVLVVRLTGDPDITMDTAMVTLHSASRKMKLSPSYLSGRHLQWDQRVTTPMENWVVHYSKMIPETATEFTNIDDPAKAGLYFERREETEVAEILHIGRYENIPQSLKKLNTFISEQGYRKAGFYEEVYLLFEQIEPEPSKYETLLRYEVTKQ